MSDLAHRLLALRHSRPTTRAKLFLAHTPSSRVQPDSHLVTYTIIYCASNKNEYMFSNILLI